MLWMWMCEKKVEEHTKPKKIHTSRERRQHVQTRVWQTPWMPFGPKVAGSLCVPLRLLLLVSSCFVIYITRAHT